MIRSYDVISKLIDRYDYGGALQIINEIGLHDTDVSILIESCKYAINFDFQTSYKVLDKLSNEKKKINKIIELQLNLKNLIDGRPNDIFAELIENIKFQLVNEEYIDFLGRVYRFKEAIFKYMFVKKHLNLKNFSFLLDVMSKRRILKMLRKKYRIFNSNLIYGITTYINRYLSNEKKYKEIVKLLNSEKMTKLIELRNNSIVGHGFRGVSREEIAKMYGNPYNVLDDFKYCLNLLDIKLVEDKYNKINEFIRQELETYNSGCDSSEFSYCTE